MADVQINSDQKPAVLTVGPFETFEVFSAKGALVAYMEIPSPGSQKHNIDLPLEDYPLTVKFTLHEAPKEVEVAGNFIPENAVEIQR